MLPAPPGRLRSSPWGQDRGSLASPRAAPLGLLAPSLGSRLEPKRAAGGAECCPPPRPPPSGQRGRARGLLPYDSRRGRNKKTAQPCFNYCRSLANPVSGRAAAQPAPSGRPDLPCPQHSSGPTQVPAALGQHRDVAWQLLPPWMCAPGPALLQEAETESLGSCGSAQPSRMGQEPRPAPGEQAAGTPFCPSHL